MSAPDFEALGLLDGLDGAARDARVELLEWLHADGCSAEELQAAAARGAGSRCCPRSWRWAASAQLTVPRGRRARRAWRSRRSRRCAAPPGCRCRRATSPALGELDLFGARALAAFIEGGLPVDGLIEASRIFGEAAAHAAAAAGTLANVAIPQEGDTRGRRTRAAWAPPRAS